MARLSTTKIFGKLRATGEAIISGAATVKDTLTAENGVEVEGGTIDKYATVRAGPNATSGHLMLDGRGGNVHIARDGGEAKIHNGKLTNNLNANDKNINSVNSISVSRDGLNATGNWLEINGGNSGILASYDDNNEFRHYGKVTMFSNSNIEMQDGKYHHIKLKATTNNGNHNRITGVGSINFVNQEWSDTDQNSKTMAWDASEGFLFGDDINTSGELIEGKNL